MKTDEDFKADIAEGLRWQHEVAYRLIRDGFAVQVPVQNFDDRSDWAAKEIDIVVGSEVIEVKSRRNMKFTSHKDWDYPTAIVDTVKKFTAKKQKPRWYVFVNQSNGAIACLPVSTKPQWKEKKRRDRSAGFTETFYEVPRKLLTDYSAMVADLNTLGCNELLTEQISG